VCYVNNPIIKKAENKDEIKKAIQIRKIVFIKGQNVPVDIEIDGLDFRATHFIMYLHDEPIGCARIRFNKYAKLERIAIIEQYRGKGFGKKLTKFLIDYCKNNGFHQIVIHSQIQVVDFYKKLGFKVRGKPFLEADIEHLEMCLDHS